MAIQNNKFKLKSHKPALATASGIFMLVGITTLTGAVLTNTPGRVYAGLTKPASALDSGGAVTTTSINVVDSCTISKTNESTSDSATIPTGTYNDHVKETAITIICNDPDGYDVYAIGYSNDTEGNTNMLNLADKSITFPTGLATSGLQSNWSMKVAAVTDGSASAYAPLIQNDFDNFSLVPDQSTIIAAYDSAIDGSVGSSFTTTYAAFVTYDQQSGTYEGKVKYTLSHPSVTSFTKTIADAIYMQDVSSKADGGCPDTLTTGQAYQLTDVRDSEVYYVARLADGNCWLLDNLRLDLVGERDILSSANTNANDAELQYLKNGGGAAADQYATSGVANWTSGYSYSVPLINTTDRDNTSSCTKYGNGSGKCGVYYNYCAASAGTYCYGNGAGSGTPPTDSKAEADICPNGWRIPTGGTSGEYQILCSVTWGSACSNNMAMAATNDKSIQTSLSMPLSGYYVNGQATLQGSSGGAWASTMYTNANDMYSLRVDASVVFPQNDGHRKDGFSVRCVLK